MSLKDYHGFGMSVRWRLTPQGVEIEGSGIERSAGNPVTVTHIWDVYSAPIDDVAKATGVPCEWIVATIATESMGKPDVVRLEPGYVDDNSTPNKVSVGLTQTLISTAKAVLGSNVDRQFLLLGANSIKAGAGYMKTQIPATELDPPLVAAAYNAGGVYPENSPGNRWKMRQYPLGSGQHVDRWIHFFNDAVFVLANAATKPSHGYKQSYAGLGGSEPSTTAVIQFGPDAKPQAVSSYSRDVLIDVLNAARLPKALVTSTARTPSEQARAMYVNIEKYGVEAQKKLYGPAGDAVIDVYVASKSAGESVSQIQQDMTDKIIELGPSNVSRHCADPSVLCVVDISPSSLSDHSAFVAAAHADHRVSKVLEPPADPAFHLEIPQP